MNMTRIHHAVLAALLCGLPAHAELGPYQNPPAIDPTQHASLIVEGPVPNDSTAELNVDQPVTVILITANPGATSDWVGLFRRGAPDDLSALLDAGDDWSFLNGSLMVPDQPIGSTTLTFTVPWPGAYEFRYYANNSYTRIATSPPFTVTIQ